MEDGCKTINVDKLLSYCDDLVAVLKDKRDVNNLNQCGKHAKSVQSTVDVDYRDVQSSIQDYQSKIKDCNQKIEEVKSNIIAHEEIDLLKKELDGFTQRDCLLRDELRAVEEKIDELDQQRLNIDQRRQILKKVEEEDAKARTKLSFYASVTSIIPDSENQSKICGQIVEKDKNAIRRFEIIPSNQDAFETCNSVWKMIDR